MSTNYFSAANAHFCRIAEPSSRGRNIGNYFPDRGRKHLREVFNMSKYIINIGNYFPDRGRKP